MSEKLKKKKKKKRVAKPAGYVWLVWWKFKKKV